MRVKKGFTLLELLIAVTIFSIAAVVLYSTLYTGIRVMRRSDELSKVHQELRITTEMVALDLRNSLLAPIAEVPTEDLVTEGVEEEEEPIYFFKGDEKGFDFTTLIDTVSADTAVKRQICNVRYYFDAEKGGLARKVRSQSTGFADRPEDSEVLISVLEDMEVSYSYEGEDEDSPPLWLSEWEVEEAVPLGVKIKFKLKGMGRLKDITKVVLIPVGKLGIIEEGSI